uniref:Autophagy protein ATG17-like domain-containing protein n=1 Tax=Meloidogyne javanica TaxID=6303 RepID=A0A915N7S7_MELJA
MFHIFYVNQGYMLMLEPPTLGSVFDLQKSIEKSTGIGIDNQLLFLSDGGSLIGSTMLSSITGVGTDTNPIFLVRRVTNNNRELVKENLEGINELFRGWSSEMDRLNRISTTSSSAITECIELAKKCNNVAETIIRFCSNLISEHHYLHQGWKAVIANLDDSISRTQKYLQRSKRQAEKLEIIRTKGRVLLGDFDNVIEVLSKITIPSSLLSPLPAQQLTPSSPDSDTNSTTFTSSEEITLFDWLSSKDPAYSLNSLSQLMLDHLEKTDDTDLIEATSFFTIVQGVSTKAQYREIGGIDKRLTTLRSKFQHLEGILAQVREISNRIIQPIIQDSTQNIATWQKQRLNELKQPLKHIYDFAISFIDSKEEVVKNISQRFSTWVRQAYERLDRANKKLVVFEEKYSGLRQRLDLVRQIKEAPNIYMLAVPEVIRREELRKEFSGWITTHIDKCSAFIAEENRIREQFQNKLDKHFLCQLFPGMSDRIPQFTSTTPPKIDQCLPKISSKHLSELRKIFPHMKDVLIVGAPRIFQRLSVFDFSQSQNQQVMISQIRRDQSFYDRDRMSNIDAMKLNFNTSTNWLSEEPIDIVTPSGGHTFLTLTREGSSFASNTSLNSIGANIMTESPPRGLCHYTGQPQFALTYNNSSTIVANDKRESMSPLQPSAPIAIPTNNNNNETRGDEQQKDDSIGSNNFSTPDEFSSFGLINEHNRFITTVNNARATLPNYSPFRSSPKITRPLSLVRAQCANQPALVEEVAKDEFNRKVELEKVSEVGMKTKLENVQKQMKELVENLNSLRDAGKELQQTSFNEENISLFSKEILQSIQSLIKQSSLKAVEEFKLKMEKENEERLEEMETKMNEKIVEIEEKLENEQKIREEKEQQLIEKEKQISELNDQIIAFKKEKDDLSNEKEEVANTSQGIANRAKMLESAISESQDNATSVTASFIDVKDETIKPKMSDVTQNETLRTIQMRNIRVQTFIRKNDMNLIVSLGEIIEGVGALIVWNEKMGAFVAHCSNHKLLPYIVKENCLKRVGLEKITGGESQQESKDEMKESTTTKSELSSNNTSNRKWAFVLVENILLCQIRKTTNRYNLPIDTRFYCISVLPMPGDSNELLCDLTLNK